MLPSTFNFRMTGCCMVAARIIGGKLLQAGQPAMIVEGLVEFVAGDNSESSSKQFAHTWVESDGTIIDPTIAQFDAYVQGCAYHREEFDCIPSEDYLAEPRPCGNPEIFFEGGVVPDDCLQFFKETKPFNGASKLRM